MKQLLLVLSLVSAAWGQNSNLAPTCSTASAKAGAVVTCSLSLTGSAIPVALEPVLTVMAGTTPVVFTASTPVVGKTVAGPGNASQFVISGFNNTSMSSGTVMAISFTMPSAPVTITLSATYGVWPDGGELIVTSGPTVSVALQLSGSNCDINGDGATTQADVDAYRAQMLTMPASGAAVIKLKKVTDAALGGACTL